MRILSIAEFDPAYVLQGHRAALRAAGVDYRLALVDVYTYQGRPYGRGVSHDWLLDACTADDFKDLARFAAEADVIQFNPVIGQPWSHQTTTMQTRDGAALPYGPIDWLTFRAPKISYLHGSRNLAHNAEAYADHWRAEGHTIWASTLDYVHRTGAVYAPPVVDVGEPPAPLAEAAGLLVVHAPTDPTMCHTEDFRKLCMRLGIPWVLLHNRPHAEVLATKRKANAGFDHLRGSFSINTVENCFLGLVPLVGLKRQYLHLLREEIGDPGGLFMVETLGDLESYMRALDQDLEATRARQERARRWATTCFSKERITEKLIRRFEEAAWHTTTLTLP